MDSNDRSPLPRRLSSEAGVAIVVALAAAVGAFFALKTSLEYDERHILKLETRISSLEERERDDRDRLIRLEENLSILNSKADEIIRTLAGNSK